MTQAVEQEELKEEILDNLLSDKPQRRYKRVKFTEDGQLDLTDPETLAISQLPQTINTNNDIKNKLEGYRVVPVEEYDLLAPGNNRWYRAIKSRVGQPVKFISGGFLIKNGEEFLTLLNVSMKFSFNIQKNEIILFERKTDIEKLNPAILRVLEDRNYTKKVKVLLKEDLSELFIDNVVSRLVRNDTDLKRKSLVKAFTKKQNKYKKYFILSIDEGKEQDFRNKIDTLKEIVGTDIFVNNDTDLINSLVDLSFG